MIHWLVILGACVMLFGCAAAPPDAATNRPVHEPDSFNTVPWRWADYSNRVWITVSGVGVGVPSTGGTSIRKVGVEVASGRGWLSLEGRFDSYW